MADLSKIKLNGTEYDLKDTEARSKAEDAINKLEVGYIANSSTIYVPNNTVITLSNGEYYCDGFLVYCPNAISSLNTHVDIKKFNNTTYACTGAIVYGDLSYYHNWNTNATVNRVLRIGLYLGEIREDTVKLYYLDPALPRYVASYIKTIPTKTSDITNDSGYLVESDLPFSLNDTVLTAANHDTYITDYDDTALSQRVDALENAGYITDYEETDPTVPAWAKAQTKPTYTANEVGALPSSTTYVSSINGDSGAITLSIPTEISELDNDAGYITAEEIPEIPSVLSELVNDVGFITSYIETDPTVPAWAKAQNKPSYSATEVGALPASTTFVSSFNGSTGDITYSAPVSSVNGTTGTVVIDKLQTTAGSNNTEYNLIGTISTNANTSAVSVYNPSLISFAKTNDLSRLTIGSTSMPGVVRIYTSTNGASGFTDLKSGATSTNERTITFPDASGTVALTDDIPSVPNWALSSSKPSYAFSELTSHPTTLNDYGITDAYTKTEVDGLVSGVLHYKGTKTTVSALPSSGNVTGDVWHVTADGSEWAWDGSDWQELGTAVDLTGYLQSSDIAAWAKAANKPSYTASEVGALSSSTTYVSSFNGNTGAITYTSPVTSVNEQTGAVTITASSISAAPATHAHGNITSGGDMTATAAIASGDRLIINDESASKLVSSTITFGSSTTQYLANNGSWQNVPTPYDDTALAARVTALEQIPWVTYYTGSTTPTNAQGNNGDLYFQTSQ